MKEIQNLIIGFGKGGKTLAGALASKGESVMLCEESEKMFGGTCINVACIPTKTLEFSSRQAKVKGGNFEEKSQFYLQSIKEKNDIIGALRQKNYEKATSAGVEVVVGKASFIDKNKISIEMQDGSIQQVVAQRIFINTGATPFIPPIAGLSQSRFAFVSNQMLQLEQLPKKLVIVGGGYIGLEFASIYSNFGSEITIIQDGDTFLPREDNEIADKVLESLENRGITVYRGTKINNVQDLQNEAIISIQTANGEKKLSAQAILIATGRRPNVQGLNLQSASIQLTQRGAIQTDEHLQTTAPNVWAVGDVTGGLQFTYISLDDSRIILSQLFGNGERTTNNRGSVPYSVFIDPPFSRVGLSQAEAVKAGYNVKVAKLATAAIPKSKVMRNTQGLLKAIVDADTGKILGAHLFCVDSHEMINTIKIAMDSSLPYTVLRDAIYTHPTMTEALNDLFSTIK